MLQKMGKDCHANSEFSQNFSFLTWYPLQGNNLPPKLVAFLCFLILENDFLFEENFFHKMSNRSHDFES
jgi:hypothetical protein